MADDNKKKKTNNELYQINKRSDLLTFLGFLFVADLATIAETGPGLMEATTTAGG